MKNFKFLRLLAAAAVVTAPLSCGTSRKLRSVKNTSPQALLSLPSEERELRPLSGEDSPTPDTLRVVDFDGHQTIIMNAVRDQDGEMTATDRITASYVTARFRNVAERHGRVDLGFQVRVPKDMLDSRWQLRLQPDMYIMGDSLSLDPVIITGSGYRKAQLRGYQQYQRFIDSIITDTTLFINRHELEVFIERNLPEVWALRSDTTFVSDERFASLYGVTEREAVEHYTWGFLVRRNQRKIARKDEMFRRYVKAPIVSEGIRLDTVIQSDNGDFIYNYVQTVNTRPGLRKVDISLAGGIWEQDKRVYDIPRSEPLTYYISSVSGLADNSERYLKRIIERKVEAHTACYIEFPMGSAVIDPQLGNNPEELGRIESNIRELLTGETFALDSVTIVSYASPEGTLAVNDKLSGKRAEAASAYFARFTGTIRDSLRADAGVFISEDGRTSLADSRDIRFQSRSGGENWTMLSALVNSDTKLSSAAKEFYFSIMDSEADPDRRETLLSRNEGYRYMREHLYPRLRVVKFDFFLHRKGMLKDTIHTTELDTTYMRGVKCLQDRDYKGALERLRPYGDLNTAVAYLGLDRNASALQILGTLPQSGRCDYLTALALAREGDERGAVEHYLRACRQDPALIHRGNLDPEISELTRKYDLQIQ